jgi:hypothetical protein
VLYRLIIVGGLAGKSARTRNRGSFACASGTKGFPRLSMHGDSLALASLKEV